MGEVATGYFLLIFRLLALGREKESLCVLCASAVKKMRL